MTTPNSVSVAGAPSAAPAPVAAVAAVAAPVASDPIAAAIDKLAAERGVTLSAPAVQLANASPATGSTGTTPPVPTAADAAPAAEASAAPESADAAAASPSDADAAAAAGGAPEGESGDAAPLTVKIPQKRVGDPAFELTVKTPEEAERVRQLVNGYMRNNDYQEKLRSVTETQTALRAAEAMIEADPAGFLISKIPEDVALNVARALVAKHYDALKPELEAWYEDTGARKLYVAERKEESLAAQAQFENARTAQEAAAAVQRAVAALVPESAGDDDANEFYSDALRHLASLSNAGQAITPDDVPALLASRAKRFGFTHSTTSPTSPTRTPAARQPASVPSAAAPASRPAAPAAPAARPVPPAIATQRANAAAIAPPGPGAAPATQPRPPKGLNLDQALDWYATQARQARG